MANGYPSLEKLIAARRVAGPGEAIQSGLEGFLAGRKRRTEEETNRATQVLNNAKLKLQQQGAEREDRQLTAGLIPATQSPTGTEQTPEVFNALATKKPKYVKAGEAEETGGKKYIIFAQEGDPSKTVRIAAGVAGMDSKLTSKQTDHLGKLQGATELLNNIKETLTKIPAGGEGLVQEGLSQNIAARGALAIPEARLYQQVAPGAAVGIYRAVTRDDRLSDADAASRARPLLPFPGEPMRVRELKMEFLDNLIEDQKAGTSFGSNPDTAAVERAIIAQSKYVQEKQGQQTNQPGDQPQIRILRRRPAGSQ